MSLPLRRALLALVIMAAASVAALVLTPRHKLATRRVPPVNLELAVPAKFGDWSQDPTVVAGVVNPQTTELLNALYSQLLTRTYVNREGHKLMLSIAYGEDQRDTLQVHHPEVCYPAQGFIVKSNRIDALPTDRGELPVRRLETALGPQRPEPVTYWMTVGSRTTLGGVDKKLQEMRYGLRGEIPDGLLFRVSTIGADSAAEFAIQQGFVQALLAQLSPSARELLAGEH